jgi:hypothetical protein
MGVGEIEIACGHADGELDTGDVGFDALKSPEREARGGDEDGARKGYEMKPEGGWDRPELDILYEEEHLRESLFREMLPVVIEGEYEEQPEPAVEEKLSEATPEHAVEDQEKPEPAVQEKIPEVTPEPAVQEKIPEVTPEPAVQEKIPEVTPEPAVQEKIPEVVVEVELKPDVKPEPVVRAGPSENAKSESNDKWVRIGTLVEDEETAEIEAGEIEV